MTPSSLLRQGPPPSGTVCLLSPSDLCQCAAVYPVPPRGSPSQCDLPTPVRPQVHEDYDCTLNQTNIGNNNNKFYIIQLLEEGGRFVCWNRWGRVVSATYPAPASSPPLLAQHLCPLLPRGATAYSAQGLA